MTKYEEAFFYSENGWPPEEYFYCRYALPVVEDECEKSDFDQFALVVNAVYPYLRLAKNRGNSRFPCGPSLSPSTNGLFAKKSEEERDRLCPKIAWGFIAVFLAHLIYDTAQEDYVLKRPVRELMDNYYRRYLNIYLQRHSGLKFSSISSEEKELCFIENHSCIERKFWKKSAPLKAYVTLYKYSEKVQADYEQYLTERKRAVEMKSLPRKNHFGTEIRETFSNVTVGKMQGHNEAYFAGIEKRILDALSKAEATIDVCVAWFTNTDLRDKLIERQNEGITVRVIRYHDGVNASKGVDLSGLEHKEVRGERGGLFHDKFCVIDNVHTICGSYNWTFNAENKNDEDAAFHFEDYKLASTYTRRFNEIWRRRDLKNGTTPK